MLRQRAFNLDLLRVPPDEYRLDLLLTPDTHPRTGRPRAGFETVAQCPAEDASRALSLRATAQAIIANNNGTALAPPTPDLRSLNLDPLAALNLAYRLQAGTESGRPQPTLASSLFMRDLRLRVPGALLEFLDNYPGTDIRVVTAIHPSWCFKANQLLLVDARKTTNQFRTHLNRAGVTKAPGFLITCLHGEFEPFSQEFQLHFHGICAGEKLKAFNRLRNKQGYVRTPKIYRPIVINRIQDRPRQLSYIMQSFWPKKARVPIDGGDFYRRERTKTRIREPFQSVYLVWLDQWRFSDICLLNGIHIQGGKMVLS
jgi:hypothetical protein